MERSAGIWFDQMMVYWQDATLVDYGHMVLAIVLVGWFTSRLASR